jgi:WD40 repeat protein
VFKVAMAVAVAGLAVAYEQRARPPSPLGRSESEAKASAPAMRLIGHRGPVVAVASTVGDQWLVSAGTDATVRVWSADSGALVRTIVLTEGAVTAFAVDGQRALVGHKDGTVTLWDLENAKKLATFRHGSETVTSVAFLGDRLVAARRDGGIALLDLAAPETPAALLDGQQSGGYLIAAARAQELLIAAGLDRTVRLWQGVEPQLVRAFHLTDDSAAVDIAPDASYVAVGSVDGIVRVQRRPELQGPGAHAVQTFKAQDGGLTAMALGPAGLLASAGEDGSLKLWILHPRRVVRGLEGGRVRTLSFSRDGRRLLAGGEDGVIRVWSVTVPPFGAT